VRDLGISWAATDLPPNAVGTMQEGFTFNPIDPDRFLRSGQALGLQGLTSGPDMIKATLNALETEGMARLLAEPSLAVLSGESASFLAGGEFPVPSPTAGQQVIEFKEFGVRLTFTPRITPDLRVTTDVNVESDNLDLATSPPVVETRRARTTVELNDGQTLAIAGLISDDTRRMAAKAPWMGDLPVLGSVFRSKPFLNNETELVVFVTPVLAALPAVPATTLSVHVVHSDEAAGGAGPAQGISVTIQRVVGTQYGSYGTGNGASGETDENGNASFDTGDFMKDGELAEGIYKVNIRSWRTSVEGFTYVYIGAGEAKEIEVVVDGLPAENQTWTVDSLMRQVREARESGDTRALERAEDQLSKHRSLLLIRRRDLARALEECEAGLPDSLENVPDSFKTLFKDAFDDAETDEDKAFVLKDFANVVRLSYRDAEPAEQQLQTLGNLHTDLDQINTKIEEIDRFRDETKGVSGESGGDQVGFAPDVFGGIGGLTGFANVSYTNTELPSDSGALGVIAVGLGELAAIYLPSTVTGPTFGAGVDGDLPDGGDGAYVPDGFRGRFSYGFGSESNDRFYAADPGMTNGITYWQQFSGSDGISADNAELAATSKIDLTQVGLTLSARWDDVLWPSYSFFVGAGYDYTKYDFNQSASLTDLDPGFGVYDVNAMTNGHLTSNFPYIHVGGEMRFDVADRVEVDLGWNSNIGPRFNSVWGAQMTDCFISFAATPDTNQCPNPTTDAELDDSEVDFGFTAGIGAGVTYHVTDAISTRAHFRIDYTANDPTLVAPVNLGQDGEARLGSGDGYIWAIGVEARWSF
jgi:hypothetical protein